MKKIINPVMCNIGNRDGRGFCEIEYNESKGTLSIHGVIAPYSSGNCGGSCGQCTDEICEGNPIEKDGWTREMVNKFCDIWDRWHLNDMRPYCSHQKELGWDKLASKKVNIYHHTTIETKTLGWLYPKDHPDELLGKECPVCGYKYGTAWKKEEVPQEVIDWLFNLPDTKVKPAWI